MGRGESSLILAGGGGVIPRAWIEDNSSSGPPSLACRINRKFQLSSLPYVCNIQAYRSLSHSRAAHALMRAASQFIPLAKPPHFFFFFALSIVMTNSSMPRGARALADNKQRKMLNSRFNPFTHFAKAHSTADKTWLGNLVGIITPLFTHLSSSSCVYLPFHTTSRQ